jgi:putative endonuclease
MYRQYFVYIMSSKSGVLYIGCTNNLERRVFEHKHGIFDGFTKKYQVKRLVCFELCSNAMDMVRRERQLKGWTRRRKLALIHAENPEMADHARRTARDPSLRSG